MSASPDIFLSYNREDAEVARLFADAFEREGMEVWWDVTLRSGETYDEVTEAALRGAKAVVVLWSPRSIASHWVRAEATIAHRAKTLVPATIEPCDKPVMFELTQTADLCHWRGEQDDKTWLAFLGDVRRMVGKEVPTVAAKPDPAPAPSGHGNPVIAVLPIVPRSGGEELEFLAEDLTEEITRELARIRRFKVLTAGIMAAWRGKRIDYLEMGRTHDAAYLVESKLQRAGETIRLTMQLIDGKTADTLWSGRMTGNAEEIADSPENFVAAVVSQLGEQTLASQVSRAMAKTGPLTGRDHILRTSAYMGRLGSDSVEKAVEEGRLAVKALPEQGLAHSMLVSALASRLTTEGLEADEETSQEIRTHAARAMQLDGDNPRVFGFVAPSYAVLGDTDTCLRLAQRAIELDPLSPVFKDTLVYAYAMAGRTAEAIREAEQRDRLKFDSLTQYSMHAIAAMCYFLEGQPDKALEACDRSLALHPDWAVALKWKAIAASALGDESAALTATRRLRAAEPEMGIENHIRQMTYHHGLADRLAEPIATLRRLWDETEPAG